MSKDPFKLDANETVFFEHELRHVKRRSYDVKYKNLKAQTLIPVSTEAPSGADTITYRSYSQIGIAKIISDYANDFPRADVAGTEETVKIFSIGCSYGYSIKEIRRSQMAGKGLDTRRAAAARRSNDEKVDKIAWNGDADYNIQGLIDYPGISEYTLPADGTGNKKGWQVKTPDQIVRDITGLLTSITNITNGREVADTLILPIDQYNILQYTRMTDGNDKTILKYLMENVPTLKTIDWVTELKTAGAGGTAKMMAYARDPEHLTLEIPQAFEQFSPQWKGMEAKIPCHSETAGVIVYYPLSVAYADGLDDVS